MKDRRIFKTQRNSILMRMIGLCVLSVLVNFAGIMLVKMFNLPLYLDSIGTIAAAAIGGYVPGIIVGFATGVINGIFDGHQIYFISIHMIIAAMTTYFASRGYFAKVKRIAVYWLVISLVVGVFGSIISQFLDEVGPGRAGAAMSNYLNGRIGNKLVSDIISGIVTELIDKAIVVFVAIVFIRCTPVSFKEKLRSGGVWQARLSDDMKQAVKDSENRVMSLKTKLVIIIAVGTLCMAGAATMISTAIFRNTTIEDNKRLADGYVSAVAESIKADMVDEYIEKGEQVPGYTETENLLYKLRDSSSDIEYIYVYKIEEDGCHVVFDLDTDELEGSAPGDVIEFDESFMPLLPALLAGEEIEPIVSDDKYGWLLTVYKPVYDSAGKCRCYAAVDISMNRIVRYRMIFFGRLIFTLLGFIILVLAIALWFVEHNITIPVRTMASCTGAYTFDSEEARKDNVERIQGLDIRTGDEIENLYRAIVKITGDSMDYIKDIQNKTETISRMQNGLIMVLADMVESRDKCTGDHVRKTMAYVKIVLEEMQRRGMYADQISDEFIAEVVSAAPLHDIGKIHISDSILNKKGKLTDEEFEIMKKHTLYGSTIIDKAIDMVQEPGYLREAKNVSKYHHEKWNGKGYPCGLSGEDIPLSARVMAVADVFDALVSRRSYKEPFSFEKAMSIIREDAGTHFDPLVAEAFISISDQVKEIADQFEDMNDLGE